MDEGTRITSASCNSFLQTGRARDCDVGEEEDCGECNGGELHACKIWELGGAAWILPMAPSEFLYSKITRAEYGRIIRENALGFLSHFSCTHGRSTMCMLEAL